MALGSRKPTVANRIRLRPDRITTVPLTADRLLAALPHHGEDLSALLDGDTLVFGEDAAALSLEAVEGRLSFDVFTDESMRDDRMSPRRRRPPAPNGGGRGAADAVNQAVGDGHEEANAARLWTDRPHAPPWRDPARAERADGVPESAERTGRRVDAFVLRVHRDRRRVLAAR